MIDFNGQAAIVTGAGRGLGRLYAIELARRGASVVVNDLGGSSSGEGADSSVADQVVSEIAAAGGTAVASHESVTTSDGGESIVGLALEKFGRIDVVINNAGIFEFLPFENMGFDAWQRMLSVHLNGSFNVSQPAFRAMARQGYGRLVFISSSAGMFGMPANSHYGTAKAGLVGLCNALAIEGEKYGIKVNSVLPTGFSRMVTAQDDGREQSGADRSEFHAAIDADLVTPMVVWLASRACNLTHHNFAACAGRYSRVFVGLSEGWLSPNGTKPSVEDIAAHEATITATERFSIPVTLRDELTETSAMRGFSLGR